jgi:putative acetyltransferase
MTGRHAGVVLEAPPLDSRAMQVVIEPEQRADVIPICDVVRRAFRHHQSVADLVELIRASPQYVAELALVARLARDVVGFVMISHAEVIAAHNVRHDVLTLSPLAVAPERERLGIGSALVRAGLAAADATGAALVTVEGSPTYYGRLGFRFAPDFGITIDLPSWAPPDAAQVYPLARYDPNVRGRLEYPPPFAAIN